MTRPLEAMNFTEEFGKLRREFLKNAAEPTFVQRWQGVDVSQRPEMQMHELLYQSFYLHTGGNEDLDHWRRDIQPNLPWADDHFEERVCGWPINPGVEWANWENADSAATFLEPNGQFNHNYMERYWPRHAGQVSHSTKTTDQFISFLNLNGRARASRGIRHEYGDLAGVVRHLAKEPWTRQAILPVWFPEDTGDTHSGRRPCTIAYHFMCRNEMLDVVYYIRSCDFIRHFRDDCYLTLRLQLWVLEQCRKIEPRIWDKVGLGRFVMHIDSLHMFRNDFEVLKHVDKTR